MSSILDRIIRGDEPQPINPYTKSLIYADPGAGKTVLAATAPKPLFLDTENSTEVLDDWPELKRNCFIVHIEKTEDMKELYFALLQKDPAVADRETVVIDTFTEGQMRNLSEILIEGAKRDDKRSPYIAFQNDYKQSGEELRRLMVAFRGLPMHVLVTAHRTEDKDDSGRVFVRPDLPPKLAQTAKGIFGLQAFLTYEIDEQGVFKNKLYTRQTRRLEAKTRYRYIPNVIEMPTFNDILDAKRKGIEAGLDEDNLVETTTQGEDQ